MELHQLFKIQEIMENNIKIYAGVEEDVLGKENVFDLRFLGLQIKIGEIANLTKCYKYYKVKENISKEKLMIRYIDAMKFLLSIGNVHNFNIINMDALNTVEQEKSVIKVFSHIYDDITILKQTITMKDYVYAISIYVRLFARYVQLGKLLGLHFEEVYNYYINNYCSD